jgi:DNA polymerase-3 subunit epsilon
VSDRWLRQSFVVLDFETSGTAGDVVEVGAVRWRPWRADGTFDRLCRPLFPILDSGVSLHGITNEMVAAEPHFVHVLPELMAFIGDAVLVAHNAPFDRAVLRAALRRAGRPPQPNPFVDTVRLSRRFFPDAPAHDLATLCWFHRIRRARAHRALDDALATVEVFRLALECARDAGVHSTAELLESESPEEARPGREPPAVVISPEQQMRLEAALHRGDQLEIRVRSERGIERARRVVPYVIDRSRGVPRLVAYDVERGETKVFRLDRVVAIGEAGIA